MLYGFADPEHIKRERAKAKELRQSQWWRQELGKGICYHCGGKFAKELLTMDHLVPIARGGKSTKSNCVVCCKDCNNKKGHKLSVEMTMDEMRTRGDLGSEEPGSDESGDET
jgi:5-methylcytosine-specific restriction protein A